VSSPMYPGAPAPNARPTTVSVSSYLLYAAAALSLIGSILTLTTIGRTSGVYRDLYAGTAAEGMESVILVATVGGVVINVLFAVGLALLGVFNSRGRQAARVTTWVVGGIALCCSGLGLAGTAATGALETSAASGGPSAREVQDRLDAVVPGWYGPATTTLSLLTLLALVAALILLALPASNAYFRSRRQAGWDPSMPYSGYPAYPGQPYAGQPYPGQPYAGQPYPGQPYAGQPYPGQPYPGQGQSGPQPYPGQPYPGQPYAGQPYPGQPYPGQPYPGQPQWPSPAQGGPDAQPYSGPPAQPGQQPAEPHTPPAGQPPPSGSPAGTDPLAAAPGEGGGQSFHTGSHAARPPHTGSVPPADPWDRPSTDDDRRPPVDPTSQA
jgi:hypothetical protein